VEAGEFAVAARPHARARQRVAGAPGGIDVADRRGAAGEQLTERLPQARALLRRRGDGARRHDRVDPWEEPALRARQRRDLQVRVGVDQGGQDRHVLDARRAGQSAKAAIGPAVDHAGVQPLPGRNRDEAGGNAAARTGSGHVWARTRSALTTRFGNVVVS
jgi:hypothetical protein